MHYSASAAKNLSRLLKQDSMPF